MVQFTPFLFSHAGKFGIFEDIMNFLKFRLKPNELSWKNMSFEHFVQKIKFNVFLFGV